jgi:transposase
LARAGAARPSPLLRPAASGRHTRGDAPDVRRQHQQHRSHRRPGHHPPAGLPSLTPDQKHAYARRFPVHVGVDTGKRFHVMVARRADGARRKGVRVDVGRAAFDAADAHLTAAFPGVPREQMLVGLEFAGHHGFTFAHYLSAKGYQVVNVLPSVTKRLKEVEDNSQLKTDAKDAKLICRLTGDGLFVGFPFLDDLYAELRLLTVERHRLTVEITRFKNRLQSLLDLAWPEFAGEFANLDSPTALALLTKWPLPADLLAAPPRTVRALAKTVSRNHISAERVDRLLTLAKETVALPQASDVRRREIEALLARWALARAQTEATDARLAELGTPEGYESPRQILKLAGMNLVVNASATRLGRARHSKRGRPMLRQAALPARRPLVPAPRPGPRAVPRHARAQRPAEDQGGVRRVAEARARDPRGDRERHAVRPRPLARRPPGRRGLSPRPEGDEGGHLGGHLGRRVMSAHA